MLAVLVSLPGEAEAEWTWPPSEEAMDRIEENLSRHYEGVELRAYLEGSDAEQREALEFLLAWLPPSDLGALPADVLVENVELALASWHEAPWSDEIDPYIFHTYILPHRVTQEPVQRWRPKLRELTTPRVADMDLEQAALEINRFAREWRRLPGPGLVHAHRAQDRRRALGRLRRGAGSGRVRGDAVSPSRRRHNAQLDRRLQQPRDAHPHVPGRPRAAGWTRGQLGQSRRGS
jgi:hypothetical protein